MAEQSPGGLELVAVKAEDIMAERRGFYDAFMKGTTVSIAAVVVVLVLMAVFLL